MVRLRRFKISELVIEERSKSAIRAAYLLVALSVLLVSAVAESDLANSWYEKGQKMQENGYYLDADNAYAQAIAMSPDNATLWAAKGLALIQLKRYEEAISAYDEALGLYPDSARDLIAQAWKLKGDALRSLNRSSESDAAFARARDLGYVEPVAPPGQNAELYEAGNASTNTSADATDEAAESQAAVSTPAASKSAADAYLDSSRASLSQGADYGMCM